MSQEKKKMKNLVRLLKKKKKQARKVSWYNLIVAPNLSLSAKYHNSSVMMKHHLKMHFEFFFPVSAGKGGIKF